MMVILLLFIIILLLLILLHNRQKINKYSNMDATENIIEQLVIDDDSTFDIVDDSTPIIRYMDLVKFLSLIRLESIHFTRPDKFSDQYEGLSTIDVDSDSFKYADTFRQMSVVSSWNHYQTESFPLWKIYLGGSKYGVAIISDVGSFKDSIISKSVLTSLMPYGVRYVAPSYTYHGMNASIIISRKKDFYEFEKEVGLLLNMEVGSLCQKD